MTHYTVLIIVPPEDGEPIPKGELDAYVEQMLAPYDEELSVAPYVALTRKQAYADRRARIKELREILKEKNTEHYDLKAVSRNLKRLEREKPTEYWESKRSGWDKHNEKGEPLTTYNPDSKWDWYEIGGRWKGQLLTKDGKSADIALVSDIDFDGMRKQSSKEAEETWERAQKDKDPAKDYFLFGVEKGDTKERFIARSSSWDTHAVITPDGVWHERAKMGWWAVTYDETEDSTTWSSKFYDRFLKNLDPNTTLVLVDCHI